MRASCFATLALLLLACSSGGGSSGSPSAGSGADPTISASHYDQGCMSASDCVLVYEESSCCTGDVAAINANARDAFFDAAGASYQTCRAKYPSTYCDAETIGYYASCAHMKCVAIEGTDAGDQR